MATMVSMCRPVSTRWSSSGQSILHSPGDDGAEDALDSDADPGTGRAQVDLRGDDRSIDAGMTASDSPASAGNPDVVYALWQKLVRSDLAG